MELSPAQWLVLCLCGGAYGFTKTGVMGVSAVIVPLMLTFFTPGQALGIALPLLIFADFITLYLFRKSVDWRRVALAVPFGLAGVFAGWRFLVYAQSLPGGAGDAFLRRVIGIIMVLVVVSGAATRLARARLGKRVDEAGAEPSRPSTLRAVLASCIAAFGGCITMISNNGGPAWVVYMMLFRLDKYHFLGTSAWVIFALNLAKLPFSIQLGYVDASTLQLNMYMIPFVVFGLLFGRWALARINQKLFDNLVQALALFGALYLLVR